MDSLIKFKILYQSPYTDEPNKLLISEPLTVQEIMFSEDTQVDFTDGSYLRFHELEEEYTKFLRYSGFKDANNKELYEEDIVLYNKEEWIVKLGVYEDGEGYGTKLHYGWHIVPVQPEEGLYLRKTLVDAHSSCQIPKPLVV